MIKARETYLHAGRRQSCKFLLHPVSNAREHGRSPRQNDVSEKIATNVQVAFDDRVEPEGQSVKQYRCKTAQANARGIMDTGRFKTDECRLEERLGSAEAKDRVIQMAYLGGKKAGNTHRSFPTVTTCPSGSSYDFSSADDWAAVCSSCSKSRAT